MWGHDSGGSRGWVNSAQFILAKLWVDVESMDSYASVKSCVSSFVAYTALSALRAFCRFANQYHIPTVIIVKPNVRTK